MTSAFRRALIALIALGACADAEDVLELDDTESSLTDAVDARCATAFTDADRNSIAAAIRASDLPARELVAHAPNRFGYGDRFPAVALPADPATTLAAQLLASLRNGPSIAAPARAAMDAALPNLKRPAGDLHLQFRNLYKARDAAVAAGNATLAASLNAQIVALRDATIDELAEKQVMAAALAPDLARRAPHQLLARSLQRRRARGRAVGARVRARDPAVAVRPVRGAAEDRRAIAGDAALPRQLRVDRARHGALVGRDQLQRELRARAARAPHARHRRAHAGITALDTVFPGWTPTVPGLLV